MQGVRANSNSRPFVREGFGYISCHNREGVITRYILVPTALNSIYPASDGYLLHNMYC